MEIRGAKALSRYSTHCGGEALRIAISRQAVIDCDRSLHETGSRLERRFRETAIPLPCLEAGCSGTGDGVHLMCDGQKRD